MNIGTSDCQNVGKEVRAVLSVDVQQMTNWIQATWRAGGGTVAIGEPALIGIARVARCILARRWAGNTTILREDSERQQQ